MSALDLGRIVLLGGGWSYVLFVVASIVVNAVRPDPEDDGDAWDTAHDRWVDEQTGTVL